MGQKQFNIYSLIFIAGKAGKGGNNGPVSAIASTKTNALCPEVWWLWHLERCHICLPFQTNISGDKTVPQPLCFISKTKSVQAFPLQNKLSVALWPTYSLGHSSTSIEQTLQDKTQPYGHWNCNNTLSSRWVSRMAQLLKLHVTYWSTCPSHHCTCKSYLLAAMLYLDGKWASTHIKLWYVQTVSRS